MSINVLAENIDAGASPRTYFGSEDYVVWNVNLFVNAVVKFACGSRVQSIS